MKKLILFLFLSFIAVAISAQSEITSDSIRHKPSANMKQFGGFLLDMGLMTVSPSKLPKFELQFPNATKDYNRLFRLDPNVTYTQGFTDDFFPSSSYGVGYEWGFSSSQFMQMSSFKLKNGMKINMYGDYNAEGWKVPNRNALPWEKNNFRGAFELKSANGNFGIRIEVQKGRNQPF